MLAEAGAIAEVAAIAEASAPVKTGAIAETGAPAGVGAPASVIETEVESAWHLAPSQQIQNATQDGNGNEKDDRRIRRVRFIGNQAFSDGELRAIVRTRPNRQFLGIPGLTFWYQLHRIHSRIGEPPSLLDRNVLERDIERLTNFYESRGFRSAVIDTNITFFDRERLEVSFMIREGRQSQIRDVYYSGMPRTGSDNDPVAFFKDSDIVTRAINDTSFHSGVAFTYEEIAEERNRLIAHLRNNGYASVTRDSVIAVVREDTVNALQLDVLFRIFPGRIYTFGDIYVELRGPDGEFERVRRDTLTGPPHAEDPYKTVINVDETARTRTSLIARQLLFKPGTQYDNSAYRNSVNQFQNLGMLVVNQFGHTPDGSLPDFTNEILPVYVRMQTLPKHRIQLDFFGMRRLGFGAGAGIRYINNNLFQGAENFEVGLQGNFEYVSGTLLNSTELSTAYTVQRLNFPFRHLDQTPFFLNASTRYRFSWAQSRQENFTINANFRFSNQFEVRHRPQMASLLDFIELDWLDASATSEFERNLRDRFDEIIVERILEDFNPQFSSIIRYTFRYAMTDLIKRDYGFFSESSIELGGTIPFLMDRFIFDPGDVQGTVPSISLSDSTLTYSQFVRVSFDYRKYTPVLENGTFAWRAFAGYAHAFGVTRQIPLNRRFFAGGSNDIRGWPPLRLGPADLDASAGEVPINGGDLKLAGFLEYRHIMFHNFIGTNWGIAGFTDFGNIWYGTRSAFDEGKFRFDEFYNQIAVGSGFGLRLDWEYLVFRIDVAYRVHDLQRGWFNNSNPYWHFGIGHSF
ncbi:MAG: outer membrane protein assembly factor [Balneolaceae bacterium]|nr:MAG: outer membrane protein assembly factor [Balneolaceae bacterium]